jgi:hypothetical protein
MGEIISFHPPKSGLTSFYEVVGPDGVDVWGGENSPEAIRYFRLSPIGSRLLVSGWELDDEDAHIVGRPLDITELVKAVIVDTMERG